MKRRFKSSDGLTLVEILMGLALVGIITILIMNYLLSNIASYQKISDDVTLHNDANYVMTLFRNRIYGAVNVQAVDASSIEITNQDGSKIKLGFRSNKAFIGSNDELSMYEFPHVTGGPLGEGVSCIHSSEPKSCMKVDEKCGTVEVKMVIEGEGDTLELINTISYGKPRQEDEGD